MKEAAAIAAGAVLLAGAGKAVVSWASRSDFALALELSSARVLPSLSKSARALLVAHGAFESGFGNGRAARAGFNVFNLTAGSAWQGAKWTDVGGDTEYDAAGNVTTITQVWRAYGSLDEAVADYWSFLGPSQNRGRYVTARAALERGDLQAFCSELYRAGYFTLPVASYAQRLNSVLLQVKGFLT